MNRPIYVFLIFTCLTIISLGQDNIVKPKVLLNKADLENGEHHSKHLETFSKYTKGFNLDVLKGIDAVQETAPDGGGYYTGIKSDPPEAPIGYHLSLLKTELVNLERKTSYCSGASFSAFIEGLNNMYYESGIKITPEREEYLRMQEADGSRREDKVEFWGNWNADGYGNNFALIQYFNAGEIVEPVEAQPGDFMNISWKNGGGHSVVFLGWYLTDSGEKKLVYWSSQKGTNGLGDDVVSIDRIKEVMVVRVINPDAVLNEEPNKDINYKISGYGINW